MLVFENATSCTSDIIDYALLLTATIGEMFLIAEDS